MGMRTKKIFIAATALGLVLGSFDVAWGATNHSKLKKPHKSSNTQHAKQHVELVHFLERVQAGKATVSDKALEADFATLEVYRATGVGGIPPGLSKFFQAHADAVNDAMEGHTIAQLISSLKTGPAVITRYEWDKLATQVKSNTSALSTLTTTVSDDVGHLQDEINTNITDITTLTTTQSQHSTDVANAQAAIANAQTAIAAAQAAIKINSLNIQNNLNYINNLGAAQSQHSADIAKAQAAIANAQTAIAAAQAAIKTNSLNIQNNLNYINNLGAAQSQHSAAIAAAQTAIKTNAASIQKNLDSINALSTTQSQHSVDIEKNANNIHQLGLAVQTNSNQIVRVANNELRNMKAVRSLGETVKQNVAGTEINTQLAKALDRQSLIDEGALQKMNTEIFENAQALGNTTVVSEDGNDLMVGAKNLANLSQLLAVAHHHHAQAKKAIDNNLQETTARLQALHLALTKAQEVSKRDAKLTRALKEPIATAHHALKTAQRLQAMIDKQRVRLHMQGKPDSEVIAKVRAEADRTAKKITQLKALQHQITKANQYKKAADENAKRAHKQAIEAYVDSNFEQQPHSARDTLRMKENQNMMLKED